MIVCNKCSFICGGVHYVFAFNLHVVVSCLFVVVAVVIVASWRPHLSARPRSFRKQDSMRTRGERTTLGNVRHDADRTRHTPAVCAIQAVAVA